MRLWFGLTSGLLLSACATPGSQDLAQKGVTESFSILGEHRQIAACAVRVLDEEPWNLGEMQVPAHRIMEAPDGTSIELQAGFPQMPSVLIWRAIVAQAPDTTTSLITLTARRDVNPYLSGRYVFDRVKQAFQSCAAETGDRISNPPAS